MIQTHIASVIFSYFGFIILWAGIIYFLFESHSGSDKQDKCILIGFVGAAVPLFVLSLIFFFI